MLSALLSYVSNASALLSNLHYLVTQVHSMEC